MYVYIVCAFQCSFALIFHWWIFILHLLWLFIFTMSGGCSFVFYLHHCIENGNKNNQESCKNTGLFIRELWDSTVSTARKSLNKDPGRSQNWSLSQRQRDQIVTETNQLFVVLGYPGFSSSDTPSVTSRKLADILCGANLKPHLSPIY